MKRLSVEIEDGAYEAFYRLYPGVGERSRILRRIVKAIILLKKKNGFPEKVANFVVEREK